MSTFPWCTYKLEENYRCRQGIFLWDEKWLFEKTLIISQTYLHLRVNSLSRQIPQWWFITVIIRECSCVEIIHRHTRSTKYKEEMGLYTTGIITFSPKPAHNLAFLWGIVVWKSHALIWDSRQTQLLPETFRTIWRLPYIMLTFANVQSLRRNSLNSMWKFKQFTHG